MWRRTITVSLLILSIVVCSRAARAGDSDSTLDTAVQSLQAGDYKQAKSIADVVLKNEPQNPRAHYLRGLAERGLGDYNAALADIDVALASAPSMEGIVESRCTVLYDLNRLDDAISACTAAIRLNPNDDQAYDDRGLAYDAKDDAVHESLALTDMNRSIAINATNYWSWSERCELKLELHRYDEALPDCNQALALEPTDSWTLDQRGKLLMRSGDYKGAEADFSASLHDGAAVKYAHISLAQAQIELGETTDALANANAYIARFPKVSAAYLARAKIYAKMSRLTEALADARHALALATDPSDKEDAQHFLSALTAPAKQ